MRSTWAPSRWRAAQSRRASRRVERAGLVGDAAGGGDRLGGLLDVGLDRLARDPAIQHAGKLVLVEPKLGRAGPPVLLELADRDVVLLGLSGLQRGEAR